MIAYHGARLTKSAKFVEEEQWTQIDVTPSLQHTVDLLVSAATDDPAECFVPPRPDAALNGANTSPAKQLTIEEKPFFIVKATGETLGLLSDYLKIVINLELVVMDVMSRIIEFLKVSRYHHNQVCQSNDVVLQLPDMSGGLGCRRNAFGWTEEHHCEASW